MMCVLCMIPSRMHQQVRNNTLAKMTDTHTWTLLHLHPSGMSTCAILIYRAEGAAKVNFIVLSVITSIWPRIMVVDDSDDVIDHAHSWWSWSCQVRSRGRWGGWWGDVGRLQDLRVVDLGRWRCGLGGEACMSGIKAGDRQSWLIRGNGGEGVGGDGSKFWNGLEYIGRIGAWASKVLVDHVLKCLEGAGLDVKLLVEILTHLVLHLVDLPQLDHALTDYQPGLVWVGIIADHLGGDHECADEETMARWAASSRKSGLEPLQEDEGSKCYRRVEFCPVQGVSNKIQELHVWTRWSGRVLGTCKQMRDGPSTEAGCVLMAIVGIRFWSSLHCRQLFGLLGSLNKCKLKIKKKNTWCMDLLVEKTRQEDKTSTI